MTVDELYKKLTESPAKEKQHIENAQFVRQMQGYTSNQRAIEKQKAQNSAYQDLLDYDLRAAATELDNLRLRYKSTTELGKEIDALKTTISQDEYNYGRWQGNNDTGYIKLGEKIKSDKQKLAELERRKSELTEKESKFEKAKEIQAKRKNYETMLAKATEVEKIGIDNVLSEYESYLPQSAHAVKEDARLDRRMTTFATNPDNPGAAATGQFIGNWISEKIRGQATPKASDGIAVGSYRITDKWTEEAKTMLATLYLTDKEEAVKFAEQVNRSIDLGEFEDFAKQNWGTAIAAQFLQAPVALASGVEYLENAVEYGGAKITGQDAELRRSYGADVANALTSGGAQAVDWNIGEWDAWDFLYGTGTSMINTKLASGLFGQAGGVMLGLSAAASTTNDILDRGGSDVQALIGGGVAGVFEAVFESWSLGKLEKFKETSNIKFFDMLTGKEKLGIKEYSKILAKDIAKSVLVNAQEEGATELANIIYDTIVNADISNYKALYDKYIEDGYTPEEARGKAIGDLTLQVVEAAGSGALMGAGFGATGNVSAYRDAKKTNGKINTQNLNLYGSLNKYGGSEAALVSEALSMPTSSNAYALGLKFQEKISNGEHLSGAEITALVKANEQQMRTLDIAKINTAVKNRLVELGEKSDFNAVADAVTKQITGEALTKTEKAVIENSTYGQRVLNEASPDNINAGDYSSSWAESIDTDKINFEPYGKNSITENIDGAADNGYNGNNNSVDNGGISDVNISNGEGTFRSNQQSKKAQSGGIEKGSRAWQEDESEFLRRTQSIANGNGQGKRILRLGNSLFAYSESEADGSSAANAVNILKSAGIDAIYCYGVTETNKNGVTSESTQAVTTAEGKVYVSSDATLPDIRIAAHEAVHVNDIKGTEAYSNFESIVCENILWDSDAFLEAAKKINDGNYHGRYDISKLSFGNAFVRELTAYVNEYVVYDIEKATKLFSSLFDNWDAVVEASRKFNEDIGIDYTIAQSNSNNSVSEADSEGSAFSMDENSDLQSTAKGNELDIETMSFEEDSAEDTAEELSYEEKIMLESSGIDTSVTQKQKRIDKIAKRLGVKIAWDIDGDPSEVGNGYYENGVIHMNKRAKALATVFAHEYIHHIEQSKLWSSFKKFIEGTKAYKDWITVRGGNSDVEQAEKNYKLRLETAYSKAGKEVADSDVIANFMAERFFGGSFEGDTKAEENAALLLSEISKSDKWYHDIIRWARQMISKFKGDKLGEEFYKMEGLLLKARKDVQKNPTTNTGGRKYSFEGYSEDGKGKYKSNFEKGTPKFSKAETILKYIQNVWSKKPIRLKITENGESRYIEAKFDPTYDEAGNIVTDASKLMGGNRHGTSSEQRVTLDLADDYYQIATESKYNYSKDETGKDNPAHKGVKKWHYFINDIYFAEYGSDEYKPYRVSINIKERADGDYVYSFSAEKQEKSGTPRTLHAVVNEGETPNANAQLSNNKIPQSDTVVKKYYMQHDEKNSKSNHKNSVTPASEAETIARLAKEGRSAEYIQSRVNATIDADRVANRWLTTHKSSYDKTKLTEKINRMVQLSNNNVWDSVLELAKETAEEIYKHKNTDGKINADALNDTTMSIFNEIVENRESVRLGELVSLEGENGYLRQRLGGALDDVKRKKEQLDTQRLEVKREVEKERTERDNRVKNRERVRRAVRSLDSKLRTNSNVKHVPEGLQSAVRDFCQLFLVNDKATFKRKDLADLYVAYCSLGDGLAEDVGGYSEYIEDMIKTAASILDGKSLPQLKDDELVMLRDIAENLVHIVNSENEMFLNGRKTTLEKVGSAALSELQKRDSKRDLRLPGGDKINATKDEAQRFFGTGNLKPIYFFQQLGGTFQKMFDDMLQGQYDCVRHLETAQTFVQNTLSEFNYWKWIEDSPTEIKLKKGGKISLTKGQAMALYATWKREQTNEIQSAQHLYLGGVVLNDKQISKKIGEEGKKGLLNWQEWVTKAHKLTPEDMDAVVKSLSGEQISFVDTMVEYLSNDMAVIGNKVTMELYGIKRFKEDYYFPYKTAENFRPNEANGKKKETKLKNASFTKQTVEKANTPIVVDDFLEVWSAHVAQMCQYSTMTIPIENMSRVFGFRKSPDDNFNAQAVRAEVQRVAGKEGVQYVQQLIDDLNGGLVSLPGDKWYQIAVSKFKKNAVFASASVVIQQPSAICRAFSVIDMKYFVKTTLKISERNYAELKRYCPVAVLKEAGRFDVGTGSQFADWIVKRSYKGIKEKAEAFIKDSEYRDDKMSGLAAKADEMTWAHIWAAAKAQVKATTTLKIGSEEFYQAAAKLFNEAIEKTQVYDSVLTRSENMRSKSSFTQMTTAFMAEPTTTLNMLRKAVDDVRNGDIKTASKAFGSVVASIAFNAILKSFVIAARDDDEDETYSEKYLQAVIANFTGDIAVWNMIPVIKDVASIFEGYSVERTDVSLVEDLYKALKSLSSDNYTTYEKFTSVVGPLAAFFGLPVKNVIRDAEAAWNLITMFIEKRIFSSGTAAKYAALEGMPWGDDSDSHYYEMLYEAQHGGDEEWYQEVYSYLISKGKDETDIKSGIRRFYRESEEVQRELDSYEEKIVRMTYYDKLSQDKKDNVLSRIRTYLVEKAINDDTGEEMSASSIKADEAERRGVDAAVYLLASAGFEDADNSGGISYEEKAAAINKMDIPYNEKVVLLSLYKRQSKKQNSK